MSEQRPRRPLNINDPPELKKPLHAGEMAPGVPINARTPTASRINEVREQQRHSALGRFADVKWEDPANPGQPPPAAAPHPKLRERLELRRRDQGNNQLPPPQARAANPQLNPQLQRSNSPVNPQPPPRPPNVPPFVRQRPIESAEDPVESRIVHDLDNIEAETETVKPPPAAVMDRATQEDFERVNLPSHFVPYDFSSLQMRRFKPFELAKLHRAQREENFTLVVDVMDSVVDHDIRNLTVPDYLFLMYKQRLDSFLKSPFKIPFRSKYGNNYDVVLTDSKLNITELSMSKDEYKEWQDKGIVCPTVRDWEILQTNDLDAELDWLWQRAQYLYLPLSGDPKQDIFHEKIQLLNDGGIPLLEDIRDYQEKIKHGVVETVSIIDEKFEPNVAIEALRKTSLDTREVAAALTANNIDAVELYERANQYAEEADLIEATIGKGETYQPSGQEVTLTINTLHFFPGI